MLCISGEKLQQYIDRKAAFPERRQISCLCEEWLDLDTDENMLVVSGLQRTGKTVALLQAARNYIEKSVYFLLSEDDDWDEFTETVGRLHNQGIDYFFIDEASALPEFVHNPNVLTDYFSDCRFMVTGTASLSLEFMRQGKLVGRAKFLNATWVSWHEHRTLLGTQNIDDYIETGGIFPNGRRDIFKTYAFNSIATNIRDSLLHSSMPMFGSLQELEDEGLFLTAINNIIHHDQHQVAINVVRDWELYDLKMAREQTRPDSPEGKLLRKLQPGVIMDNVRKILGMREKQLLMGKITKNHIVLLKSFLEQTGLLIPARVLQIGDLASDQFPVLLSSENDPFFKNEWILTQPGLRWNQVDVMLGELQKAMLYSDIPGIARSDMGPLMGIVFRGIKNNARGRILEGIVSHHARMFWKNNPVFTWRHMGEVDVVAAVPEGVHLFEIKNSQKYDSGFSKHIRNPKVTAPLVEKLGPVLSSEVIFRGKTACFGESCYTNAGEWLDGLEDGIRKNAREEFFLTDETEVEKDRPDLRPC